MIKRAIVTGATGVIGTALVEELIDREIEVLVLCRFDSKRIDNIPKNPLVTIKDCSLEKLSQFVGENDSKYDVMFHLAWAGTTGEARDNIYIQNKNIEYSLDAVKLAKRVGCEAFIGIGSQAEYGRVEGMLRSNTPTFPETGYGMAKLCAGLMTRKLAKQLEIKHNWIRVLSIYGPNDGYQSMVMSTISKLRGGEIPKLTKGEQIWDYLYSKDAARAMISVAEKGIDGKVYVLGSGDGQPLREYIETIKEVVAPEGKLGLGEIPYAINQVMYLVADISEISNDTGWKPTTDFRNGVLYILDKM